MKNLLLASLLFWSITAWGGVDLNRATQEELEGLSGIGPIKARAIINYRSKHGAFKSVEELNNVPGFGEKTVKRLAKEVSVSTPHDHHK